MGSSIKSILSELLGSGIANKSSGDIAYFCPFCHHHKRKLYINVISKKFHCWVCGEKGRSLFSLLKKIKAPKKFYKKLNEIDPSSERKYYTKKQNDEEKEVALPEEFIPLYVPSNTIEYKHAIKYLRRRGLSPFDILRYKIGYCDKGEFAKKIIIPSYDGKGDLNFFVGRSYYASSSIKYKNPKFSKNIIGFELFINWNLPVILVEGVFDAISIKRNVIPLFGKTIPHALKKMIIKKKAKEIYICLDGDAIRNSVKFAEEFLNQGLNVYFVEVGDQDPSDMGFHRMAKQIADTNPMTLRKLVEYKLSI